MELFDETVIKIGMPNVETSKQARQHSLDYSVPPLIIATTKLGFGQQICKDRNWVPLYVS